MEQTLWDFYLFVVHTFDALRVRVRQLYEDVHAWRGVVRDIPVVGDPLDATLLIFYNFLVQFNDFLENVKLNAAEFLQDIIEFMINVNAFLAGLIGEVDLPEIITDPVTDVLEGLGDVIDWIRALMDDPLEAVVGWFSEAYAWFRDFLTDPFDFIRSVIGEVNIDIPEFIEDPVQAVIDWLNDVADWFADFLVDPVTWFRDWLPTVIDNFDLLSLNPAEWVIQLLQSVADEAGDLWLWFRDLVTRAVNEVLAEIGASLENINELVITWVLEFFPFLEDILYTPNLWISTLLQDAFEWAYGMLTTPFDTLMDHIEQEIKKRGDWIAFRTAQIAGAILDRMW